MANDTIRTGKKYRILTNAGTRAWDVISFWTRSIDVEMNDGNSLEDNLGGIKGIVTEKTDETGYVMDASVVSEMKESMEATPTSAPIYDSTLKYAKGDLVNYNESIYYCIVDITNPETWNATHWSLVSSPIRLQFGFDSDGNYGYIKAGADSVTPFSSGGNFIDLGTYNTSGVIDIKNICSENGIDYSKLSNTNFIFEVNKITNSVGSENHNTNSSVPWNQFLSRYNSNLGPKVITPSVSYNNANGVLTYNIPSGSANGGLGRYTYDERESTTTVSWYGVSTVSLSVKIYLIVNVKRS